MHKTTRYTAALAATALCSLAGQALAQPLVRAAFVANNGNIEGSVTAYTFSPTGEPIFRNKYITGSGSGHPGNNAYGISLTPDGRYLATTHATALTTERITLFQVNADASLEQVSTATTPDSPLACQWVSNDLLAVTKTSSSIANQVILYRLDRATNSLSQVDAKDSGFFTGYLALHPNGQFLFAQDSPLFGGSYHIRTFQIDHEEEELIFVNDAFTSPFYALGLSVTPDGRRIYGGGGISSGGTNIVGFDVDSTTGHLTWMLGSPFQSPPPPSSPSPKQAVATPDNKFLFVGHGSSSVVRSFAIDEMTGALTDTGHAYDVGIQGDLGGIAVLGNWVLFTRKYSSSAGPTGLMSWTVHPDGSFTPNGPVVSSAGSLPQFIVAWNPPGPAACYANCDQSTAPPILNVADFSCFLTKFASGDTYANCDQSTTEPTLNVADFSCFLSKFAGGCQ